MESVDVDKFPAIIIKTEIEEVVETKVKIEYYDDDDQLESSNNCNYPINYNYPDNGNYPIIKTEEFLEEVQHPNYEYENIDVKNEFLIEQSDVENHNNLSGHDLVFQAELENENKKYKCESCGKSFSLA